MMNQMQEWMVRAAEDLGIRIVVGYVAQLSDGISCSTQALFPDLGGALGTLVFDSALELNASIRNALVAQGFSISTFSEPLPNEQFDLESYAEMFSEWGWTNEILKKPAWM